MSRTVLIATDKPFSPDARDEIVQILKEPGYDVRVLEKYPDKAALIAALADAEAVIVRSDVIDAEVLAAAPKLRLVVRAGAGYDTIDTKAARERDIPVMNTPGQNANAVAELVFGMLVYVARGRFDGKTGTELRGKTLGIHALGNVGRAVLEIAKGFGMQVAAHDPYVSDDDMRAMGVTPTGSVAELYAKCQYVSLHIPATSETKGSIGEALLSSMPKGGTLVNTARKEVIDEDGLVAALAARKDLRYVTDIAPSAATHERLLEAHGGQYYATPNKMGAQTLEANTNAGTAAARQIVGFFERGERAFIVN